MTPSYQIRVYHNGLHRGRTYVESHQELRIVIVRFLSVLLLNFRLRFEA